jgi:ligand-binding sensor domain-containing protein/signal transduction histidine kinase
VFASFITVAQPYYFNRFQVENGLSNNAVMTTLQDKHGFMWFGTKDGLNRYDGYSFKVFRNDPGDSNSIGRNIVYSLFEEEDGTMWVGTDRGLFIYDPSTEAFTWSAIAPLQEITEIIAVGKNERWMISRGSLLIYNKVSHSTEAFKQPRRFDATSMCLDDNNGLWVTTTSGSVEWYDKSKKTFESYNLFAHSAKPISSWIQKITYGGAGKLIIGTAAQGLKFFDTRKKEYTDLQIPGIDPSGLFVRDILQYSDNELWIGSESGIIIYHIDSKKVTRLRKNYNDPYSISDNAVYSFCKDREGGVWAGTYFGGVNYYPKQFTRFDKFFPQYLANSISGNAVREIVPDGKGNLLIGTEDAGLNILNPATGLFDQFSLHNRNSNSNVHGLLVDGNKLWIGTFQHGLDQLDLRTGKKITHYDSRSHGFKTNFIYDLAKSKEGDILAATNQGIYIYNVTKDDFVSLADLPETFYTFIFQDSKGMFWIGSAVEGLFTYDPVSHKTNNFRYHPDNKRSLADNHITWIHEDRNHTIWVATESGLCRLDRDKDFTRYTIENDLPSNLVFAMLEDRAGHFWVSTSKGLADVDPVSGKVKSYTRANGLISDQFNYNSAFKDSSGRMYFGTVKGMISFHPEQFILNKYLPPVYITGLQLYDKEQGVKQAGSPLQRSVSFTDKIVLNHDQSTFSLDFAGLSFTAPERTRYAYRLAGLDDNWTFIEKNRKVYFTEVPPGKYRFEVKASNSSDIWNVSPATLEIQVKPPWWLSSYAYTLYFLLAGTFIWLALRFYHRRVAEINARKHELMEHEKEREIYHSKIEFFTNVAHEIRTPLTLIKGPMEKVMRNQHTDASILSNLRIMQRNTDRLLDLTTQLLDFRKTETNGFSLNFVRTDVAALLRDNMLRFKTAAEQKDLRFTIETPGTLPVYIDTEAVNKILSNLLNNAIKYAESQIDIRLPEPLANDLNFHIIIANDGPLIPYEMREKIFETFFRLNENSRETGTGIGLALARSLAELHRGSLKFGKPVNHMNVFEVELPMHQDIEFNLATQKTTKLV